MKKVTKSLIAIFIVIAILGGTVLTLGLIKINPMKVVSGGDIISVYDIGSADRRELVEGGDARAIFETALEKTGYSVLYGAMDLEFNYQNSLLKTTDDNGDQVNEQVNSVEIADYLSGNSLYVSSYKVKISFDDVKTIVVEGKSISYDTVEFLVNDTFGQIEKTTLLMYEYNKAYNEDTSEDGYLYYNVTPVIAKVNMSSLFDKMEDVFTALNAPQA